MHLITSLFVLCSFIISATATCFDPSPAFPVPAWTNGVKDLGPAFEVIQEKLEHLVVSEKYDTASFSIEITTNLESLIEYHHAARKRNESRPGVERVNGDSLYRIASISKVFTVLGLLYQHQAGNLTLDEPIGTYITELSGEIPWKDITLRILASQLSGIPRDWAQVDIINELPDPTAIGLPPASKKGLPACDEYDEYHPCNASDLFEWTKEAKPLFAPNQQSTYSNVNFELIGLALERATGITYKEYMREAIFEPLDMKSTTLDTPSDKHAVIPLLPDGPPYWDVDEGVQNPTGGIYSSSKDMSKFIRYILTHYNALVTGVNWLMPSSWATGIQSFYGMPFEIFRTDKILKESRRPVTFVTKSGGLPGYTSRIFIMPEYGLGITILVGCGPECGNLLGELQEIVSVPLVQIAESATWEHLKTTYTRHYAAVGTNVNSSLTLNVSASTGLIITSFISNGTDVFRDVVPQFWVDGSRPWRLQLVPTLLFKNETNKQGEIWRSIPTYERRAKHGSDSDPDPDPPGEENQAIWDEFCTTDVDSGLYAGLPLNEIVFWHEEDIVEMPAWKVKMKAVEHREVNAQMVVQG